MPDPTDPQTTSKRRTIYGWVCAALMVFALVVAGPQASIPLWLAMAAVGAMKILEPA